MLHEAPPPRGHTAHWEPKRIFVVSVMLTDTLPHGDGLLAYRFIRELAARGHDLVVACEWAELAGDPPPNARVHRLPLAGGPAIVRRLEYARQLRLLFAREQRERPFDVIHQINPVYNGLSLGLAGTGTPLVIGPLVSKWFFNGPLKNRALDGVRWLAEQRADALIVATDSAHENIVDKRRARGRTHLVPFGVDTSAFTPRPFPPGDPAILFLAALTERKGIGVLLDAFEIVAERCPTARLIVAGDGERRADVEQRARASRFAGRITLAGRVAREAVADWIARSTLFCLPSLREPYGMSAIEAMSAGRPVVVSRAGGLGELVEEGGGRRVPPGDPRALADALLEILTTPGLAAAMGAFNRKLIERRNAWPVVLDRIEGIYANVVRA